jgi:PAS domain S-box-containing protein
MILLVEDEMIVSLMETRTLEGFGYRVITASTGEAAVEAACSEGSLVDLVLMDIDLGEGIDGTEAARRILTRRALPIVFLTSHSERECVEKVQGITRYGYVVKNSGDFVLQSSIEMAFELFAAHEKMRTSQARLSTLLKTIPDLVWLKDAAGVYLTCNPAFERFIGAKESEIVGKTDYDFLSSEEADFFRGKDREAIDFGNPHSNEEWITFADDGHRAFLETIKTPMVNEAGKLVGVLGIGRDITERKRIEVALKESEESVRRKLDAIVEPEGDLGELGISDIVDVETLQSLIADFSALTGMVVALLDTKGRVLIATGWQDICTKFHRACSESSASCTESDLFLSANVKPGEYVEYRCKNNMWDIVTPFYIESRHVGNIYSGQYFYDDDVMDEKVFIAQAKRYGFDEEEYLSALRRVPRFSHEDINLLMDYLVRLTGFISRLSYSNLQLARAITDRRRTEELLSKSVTEKEMLLKELQHRVKNSLNIVSSFLQLNMADLRDEDSQRVFQEAVDRIGCVATIYERLSESTSSDRVDLGRYLTDLADLLRTTYAPNAERLRITMDFAAMDCDLKRAVSLGLILNELFTNALKYAHRPGETGEIRLSLSAGTEDGPAELRISDDGPGLPPGLDLENVKSLGLRIASLLAEEIGGSLEYESEGGATAIVRF